MSSGIRQDQKRHCPRQANVTVIIIIIIIIIIFYTPGSKETRGEN